MATTKCDWCSKVLDEADFKLNDRRYKEYLRRYPDAGLSDNFGDRPNFKVLCGTCTANHLHDEADRRRKETFLDALEQGSSHPHFERNFFIVCIIIFLLGVLLLGRR
jgi:hypothetical protein